MKPSPKDKERKERTFNIKDVIKDIDKIRHLHFANPSKKELAKKLEFIKSGDFDRVVKILVRNL